MRSAEASALATIVLFMLALIVLTFSFALSATGC